MASVSHRQQGETEVVPASLVEAIATFAGRTLVLDNGTYVLDGSVTSTTTTIKLSRGTIIEVPVSRTLGSYLDFSEGGQIKPASTVTVTLTGSILLAPTHYAFDVSAGGFFNINQQCLDRLTPYNFGAIGTGDSYDDVPVRAWARSCQWSIGSGGSGNASGGIQAYVPPGSFKIGSVHDTDSRGDQVCVTWSSLIDITGVGERVSRFWYQPQGSPGPTYYCFRWEEVDPLDPSLNPGISNISFNANQETALRKVAMDVHDVRNFKLRNMEVLTWSDVSSTTGTGSIALRIRGRDACAVGPVKFNCNLPILVDYNDDETAALDGNGLPTAYRDTSNKDLDHWSFTDCDFLADNVYKACILVRCGVVFRNFSISDDCTSLGGAVFMCVDRLDSGGVPFAGAAVVPRRTSNGLAIECNGRIEGIENPGIDTYAVRIERHQNAPLREMSVNNFLLAEGYDGRRHANGDGGGLTGAAWHGIRAYGVRRVSIAGNTRYGGTGTPFQVDSNCKLDISPNAELVNSDNNVYLPESADQWTHLETTSPRSWFIFRQSSNGDVEDIQDSTISGLADLPLTQKGATNPTARQLKDGWLGYWAYFTNQTNQGFKFNETTVNPNSQPYALSGLVWPDTTWVNAGNEVFVNIGGTGIGPLLRVRSDGFLELRCNAVNAQSTLNYFDDDQPFMYKLLYDPSGGGLIQVWLRKFDGTQETFTVTYFAGIGNDAEKGFCPHSTSVSSPKMWQCFGVLHLNAAAQATGYSLFDTLKFGV